MNITEFFELTGKVRAAQKLYYKSRLQGDLFAAKGLESQLDKALNEGLDLAGEERPTEVQANLFTEEGNEKSK